MMMPIGDAVFWCLGCFAIGVLVGGFLSRIR